MIPRHLRIAGFLSYRDAVEIDFTRFDLACISGHNGAGKSSLLDAITWALFGEARGRQEAVINLQSPRARVDFTFELEGNVYRVVRSLERGKSVVLEFELQDGHHSAPSWRPLTERTVRETQARLESLLRMDYETFINTSFFLQGKADQFAQQTPSRRKEVLASVLGLEIWENYRERAAERRRQLEEELARLEGSLKEIEQELGEEATRQEALRRAEEQWQQCIRRRQEQEQWVNHLRDSLKLFEMRKHQLEAARDALRKREEEYAARARRIQEEQEKLHRLQEILQQEQEIRDRYHRRQALRAELDSLEALRFRFSEVETQRKSVEQQVQEARVRLEQELHHLQDQATRLQEAQAQIPSLEAEREHLQQEIAALQARLETFEENQKQREALHQEKAARDSENRELKRQMDALKERLDRLEEAGARCPLCGQPLTAEHLERTKQEITLEGKEMGRRYRENLRRSQEIEAILRALADPQERNRLLQQMQERIAQRATVETRLQELHLQQTRWEKETLPRLQEVERLLQEQAFAPEAQQQLRELEQALQSLGYDPASHRARQEEFQSLQGVEEDYRLLEQARFEIASIEKLIAEWSEDQNRLQEDIERKKEEIAELETKLQPFQELKARLEQAEDELLTLKEAENQALAEVGARRQAVEVLEAQRQRARRLQQEKEQLQARIGHYRALERAFGKDGVPALLIEQALPQIEAQANEILDRLSNGQLSLRFITQAEYRDKRREDRRETLEIQISDPSGVRPYEMYSGGEAFRINFALRLALAQVLAHRRGARLQTLIIDEGFGSQDPQGLQRLVEAINLVKPQFAKILVITHLDELKDAFPVRIEVEKGPRGSNVRIIEFLDSDTD
jgi:exonuclease SbcC